MKVGGVDNTLDYRFLKTCFPDSKLKCQNDVIFWSEIRCFFETRSLKSA
jgi:hypothetical protein